MSAFPVPLRSVPWKWNAYHSAFFSIFSIYHVVYMILFVILLQIVLRSPFRERGTPTRSPFPGTRNVSRSPLQGTERERDTPTRNTLNEIFSSKSDCRTDDRRCFFSTIYIRRTAHSTHSLGNLDGGRTISKLYLALRLS